MIELMSKQKREDVSFFIQRRWILDNESLSSPYISLALL